MTSQTDNHARRVGLRAMLKVLASLIFISIVWIGFSFVGNVDEAAIENAPVVRVGLDAIEPGEAQSLLWNNRPLQILSRTPAMIQALSSVPATELRDPLSKKSRQPSSMQNLYRSSVPAYFVAIATGTDLGCPVAYLPPGGEFFRDRPWPGGFRDTCRGSRYDLAGRVFKGQQAEKNLEIPDYRLEGKTLVIGVKD